MSKIVNQKAAEEIASWLDYKHVSETKRELYKTQVDVLVEAMGAGELTMNPTTHELTQKLNIEIDGVGELVFKPRLTVGDMRKGSTNVKPLDFDGKTVATIASATGKGMASVIDKMDSSDFDLAQAIAVFF